MSSIVINCHLRVPLWTEEQSQVADERHSLVHSAQQWSVFHSWDSFLTLTHARNSFRGRKKPYIKNSNPIVSFKEEKICLFLTIGVVASYANTCLAY